MWYQIPIPRIDQPKAGTYRDWKTLLAAEGKNQCAYCAIHEARWGGERNFHVEHYRPKKKFEDLENVIENLFYACSVCNGFKREDWPGEPTPELDVACYPSPSGTNYNDIMDVDDSWRLRGRNRAAKYVIARLALNRAQLILERRQAAVEAKVQALLPRLEGKMLPPEVIDAVNGIAVLLAQAGTIRPYSEGELARPTPRETSRSE